MTGEAAARTLTRDRFGQDPNSVCNSQHPHAVQARILANMETCAPKLFAIAENIVQLAEKVGTSTARVLGYFARAILNGRAIWAGLGVGRAQLWTKSSG